MKRKVSAMRLIRGNSGKLPLMMIIGAVVVLGLVGGGFGIMKMKKAHSGKPDVKKVELSQWKLEEFLVNLADTDESRYLKAVIVLEVKGTPPASGGGEGKGEGGGTAEIKARDAIITAISRRTYSSMLSEQGKMSLKAEIKEALNSTIEEPKVENVYFTSFAMQ